MMGSHDTLVFYLFGNFEDSKYCTFLTIINPFDRPLFAVFASAVFFGTNLY